MGAKGKQTTTQQQVYTPNQAVGNSANTALTMAQGAAGLPFQQQQAPVASFSDDQMSAFADMRKHQGMAQPYFDSASQLFNQSAQPISASQVGNYLNPYANYVMAGMQDIFGEQRRDTTGRLTQAAGGVGADRIGVGQANLAKQQGLSAGQTLAGLYQPALNAAQQDAQRQQSAAFGMGQLGPAAQNAAMMGTQGLYNFGGLQQQQQQAKLNAPYQWDMARIAHNYQIPQWLSGITAQNAPALGGATNTTNTYPGQSPWGQIAGLGMTAAGAAMGNPGMMKGGMSMAGAGGMGGASQGPMGYGGYQPGMSAGPGFQWQPSPNGPGGMAPMAFDRGGSVNLYDAFQSFDDGGQVLDFNMQSDGSFADRFSAVNDDPRQAAIDAAMEDGAPLPESASVLPPQPPPMPPGLPQITGDGQDGMPPSAMGFSATPRAPMPPPAAMAPQQPQPSPYEMPPDPGEGSFSRSPGMALMNAGLATLAASGRRDSRGLPMSPWSAIGEGGMKGVETLKVQDQLGTQRRRADLEARRLLQQAEHQRATLGETKRYHDILDRNRQDTNAIARQNRVDSLAAARQSRLDSLDPSRLEPVKQALIAATKRKGSPLDDNEILDIAQRAQRQTSEKVMTPVQQALDAAAKRKGSALDENEVLDIIQRSQRVPAERSPGTAEQQAIAAKVKELGRELTSTEIAQVVRTVREGPRPVGDGGEPAQSNILGDDTVAPNFEGATGGSGLYTSAANKVTGFLGSQAYPAESKATRILNDLAVKTQSTLQNISGRPSNYWLGRLESLTVKPNTWSQGPKDAQDRLVQTRATIEQELKHVESLIQTARPAERTKLLRSQGELKNLLSDYTAVLGAWGGGGGNPLAPVGDAVSGAAPSTGQVRDAARESVSGSPKNAAPPPRPAHVPPGSQPGRSKTNRNQIIWRTPDGQLIPHEAPAP